MVATVIEQINQSDLPPGTRSHALALLALCHHDNGHVAVSWDIAERPARQQPGHRPPPPRPHAGRRTHPLQQQRRRHRLRQFQGLERRRPRGIYRNRAWVLPKQ